MTCHWQWSILIISSMEVEYNSHWICYSIHIFLYDTYMFSLKMYLNNLHFNLQPHLQGTNELITLKANVVNWVHIGSGNGLSLIWHQPITWINADLLSIGSIQTNIKYKNFRNVICQIASYFVCPQCDSIYLPYVPDLAGLPPCRDTLVISQREAWIHPNLCCKDATWLQFYCQDVCCLDSGQFR